MFFYSHGANEYIRMLIIGEGKPIFRMRRGLIFIPKWVEELYR